MSIPDNLKYTSEHEWISVEGSVATVGITDHAQSELGDVVYVELPTVGTSLDAKASFGTVESVKALSDLYSPIAGQVELLNEALEDAPELVNDDPYGKGWMIQIRIEDPTELQGLMSADAYREYLEEESREHGEK
jgi:glycine cleavage system H protein